MNATSHAGAADAPATPAASRVADATAGRGAAPAGPPDAAAPRFTAVEIAVLVLASLAVIAAAKVAEPVLVPLFAGILLAYPLRPAVNALERLHVPRFGGASADRERLSGMLPGKGCIPSRLDRTLAPGAVDERSASKVRAEVDAFHKVGLRASAHLRLGVVDVESFGPD